MPNPTLGEASPRGDDAVSGRAPRVPERLARLAYSPSEAAEVLGVSRAGVYNLIAAGQLEARKAGQRTLILADELRRFLDALPVREPS